MLFSPQLAGYFFFCQYPNTHVRHLHGHLIITLASSQCMVVGSRNPSKVPDDSFGQQVRWPVVRPDLRYFFFFRDYETYTESLLIFLLTQCLFFWLLFLKYSTGHVDVDRQPVFVIATEKKT
jgi:hypothetical protein